MKTLFPDWLRQRRTLLRLSRKELARQAAISPVTLQDYELGRRRPSDSTLLALARVLRVPAHSHEALFVLAKGGEPEAALLQLIEKGSATAFQPASPTAAAQPKPRPAYLAPAPIDTIVGRQPEVEQITQLLAQPGLRLVTLAGPPGVGKTRLALEVALYLNRHDEQPMQLVFASLASAVDQTRDTVINAVAQAMAISSDDKPAALAQLVTRLGREPSLLVLDNFETVMPAAEWITEMLNQCAQLKILVTSRELLRLYGEHVQWVAPLAIPPRSTTATAAGTESNGLELLGVSAMLECYPAIALFVQRAQAVAPAFALRDDNRTEIAQICQMLDGLPLGIEIAASQLAQQSLSAIIAQLGRAPLALQAVYRNVPQRHQSLHNAIGMSYAELDEATQHTFDVLSVFSGGADAPAIAALMHDSTAGSTTRTTLAVEGSLHLLLARSLIVSVPTLEDMRYTMLETLREYGRERLEAEGQLGSLLRQHAGYFEAFARAKNKQLFGDTYLRAMSQLEDNLDNCRAALHWCLHHDRELGLMLAESWAQFWLDRGHIVEGFEWFNRLLGLDIGNDQVTDFVNVRISTLAQARALCVLAEYSGDISGPTAAKQVATLLEQQVLPLFRQHGDVYDEAIARRSLGYALNASDEYARGRVMLEAALPFFRERQQDQDVALTLQPLIAIVTMVDPPQAEAYAEEYVMRSRRTGNPELLARSLSSLSAARRWSANYEGAAAAAREAATLFRQINGKSGLIKTLMRLFLALKLLGQYDECRIVLKEYAELGSQLGLQYVPRNVKKYLGEIAYAEGNMHEALTHILASAVGALAQHDRREVGLCLTSLVPVLARLGQPHIAARISGAARACLKALAYEADPAQQGLIHDGLSLLHEQLSEADFLAAQAESNAMSLEQAVAEARGVMAARDDLVNLDA